MGNSRGRQLNLITQKIKNEHRTHWMQLTKIKQEITKRGDHHWWKLYTKVGNPKYNIKKKTRTKERTNTHGKKDTSIFTQRNTKNHKVQKPLKVPG